MNSCEVLGLVEIKILHCSRCGKETEHALTIDQSVATCLVCGDQEDKDKEYGQFVHAFCRSCGKRIVHILTNDKKKATCTVCGAQFRFKPARYRRQK